MTFSHVNRRLHLYLGLVLLPWFLMYGVSSVVFSHPKYFDERDKAMGLPLFTRRFERPYHVRVPEQGDLRELGSRIMKDAGIDAAFGAYRQSPRQINVYAYRFLSVTELKYFVDEQRLVAHDRRFRFDHFLTGMHARGGFEQEGFLNSAWGVVVDLACVGMLLWIASGIYMWWHLPSTRVWGWLAVLGGVGSFALFLWRL